MAVPLYLSDCPHQDVDEGELRIGNIHSNYIASDKRGSKHVKYYAFPTENNIGSDSPLYTPLQEVGLVESQPSLILVDEGTEFFLAVVADKKDGVALAYNDW
jgi:hypothetical protein